MPNSKIDDLTKSSSHDDADQENDVMGRHDIRSMHVSMQSTKEMLSIIQKKVLGSPALNGGFDTLLQKMENLEKHQDKVIEQIDEIHEAVYNPDEGLFARIKDAELERSNEIRELNSEILKIKLHQEHADIDNAKVSKDDEKLGSKVDNLSSRITEIERGYVIMKWLSATVATGTVLGFIKVMYDYIVTHVKLL
jgi:chromosome segregation ATPase